jgi:hypothetical protein
MINYFFLRRYDQRFIRFAACCIIFVSIFLMVLSLSIHPHTHNLLGFYAGADYPVFYIAGKILNSSYEQLYNLNLQSQMLQALKLGHDGALPNPYPPFFNFLFIPLSLFPFFISYIIWQVISVCLYVSGLFFLRRSCPNISQDEFITAVLLAISFEPFLVETCIGGQVSACGFFIFTLAIYFEKRKKHFISGFILGFSIYKPTLILIIVPSLLTTKRFKIFAGFLACALLLVLASLYLVGLKVCLDWFQLQMVYTRFATGSLEIFRSFKYVDIPSFFRLFFGNMHLIGTAVLITVSVAFISFAIFFIKFREVSKDVFWAIALSFTLIVNFYVPIYDTIIIVISLFLTKDFLIKNSPYIINSSNFRFNILLVLIFVTPWFTQHIARYIGLQVFTLIIITVVIYQASLIHSLFKTKKKE